MSDVLMLAAELQRAGTACALCTVVDVSGSVPRHAGAKLLAAADGSLLAGTIGGGLMESRVLARAREVIASGNSALERYELNDPAKGDAGVCGGSVDVFIEALVSAPQLLIVGAGHVGRALAHIATYAGFRVCVADDRDGMASAAQCPGAARYIAGDVLAQLDATLLTSNTYVALVTRGYPLDVKLLPLLLASPVRFIGVMGSKRRWLTAQRELLAAGVPADALARVRAPLGLELQAETPEEIAISILAEVIAMRRGGDGTQMSATR
jgi:xanthine dehydrogenase accessory factor